MSRLANQLICFSYHKSGTSLLLHVMTKVSERLGLKLVNHYGRVEQLDTEPDVILLPHSVLRASLDRPYRAIRLLRDPRDMWVSGYLYHRRCDEGWCRNTEINSTPPIQWPQVDYSIAHWSEARKRSYLERLNGKSYQQNLLDRSLADGLAFELDGYTGCTLATMREWKLNQADALDVRLEDVMADFDGSMLRIFDHFGFNAEQRFSALDVARSEDVRRMNDAAMAQRPQIHSRTISKWRDVLSAAQIANFEERHGDLIRELGYETVNATPSNSTAGTWSPDARMSPTDAITPNAEIWLLADSVPIRPIDIQQSTYRFVVPSGRASVRLESCQASAADAISQDQAGAGQLGLTVTQIVIRCDAGDFVIAADDPRLAVGWHDAHHVGNALWRCTDGSADLPWTGVSGPAIVTVHCRTPLIHERKSPAPK